MSRIYQDRLRLVQSLPDLREAAPSFVRGLIPRTWREDLAATLTNKTIGSAFLRDYPTHIEAFDRNIGAITGDKGAIPTYINLPSLSF